MNQALGRAAASSWSEAVASLDALFADFVEILANLGLSLDDAAAERLAKLEGRRLRIECALPEKTVTLGVQRARLSVSAEGVGEADVQVRGSMPDLLAWAASGFAKTGDRLEVAGDEALLAEFAAALRPSGLDALAEGLPGDVGENLVGALELGGAALRSVFDAGADALVRGLQELYATTPQFREFADGLADLRKRLDRLQAKIRGLEDEA